MIPCRVFINLALPNTCRSNLEKKREVAYMSETNSAYALLTLMPSGFFQYPVISNEMKIYQVLCVLRAQLPFSTFQTSSLNYKLP